MKRILTALLILSVVMYALWPAATVILGLFCCQICIYNPLMPCIVIGAVFLLTAVLCFFAARGESRLRSALSGVLLVECIVLSFFYASKLGMVLTAFCVICAFVIFFRTVKAKAALIALPIVCVPLLVIFAVFSLFKADSWDDEEFIFPSPSGKYEAVILDQRGEFLGGFVYARVYDKTHSIENSWGYIRKMATGNIWSINRYDLWDEEGKLELPSVEWAGDDKLLICGEEYKITP